MGETDGEVEEESGENRALGGGGLMEAGESFIQGKGGAKAKIVSIWRDGHHTILDLFDPFSNYRRPENLIE